MSRASRTWVLCMLLTGCGESFAVSLGSNATIQPDGGDKAQDASPSEPDDDDISGEDEPAEEEPEEEGDEGQEEAEAGENEDEP
jgi:hypothetical protein